MSYWKTVREFGTRPETKGRIVRPSAYAFILNGAGQVAVVRSSDGTFLPGGGIEGGETPEAAVMREALEECGLRIRVGDCVNRAVQIVDSESYETYVEKRCYFFDAEIERELPGQAEPGHETLWVEPESVDRFLSHESQAWAVHDWKSRITGR